MSLRCQSCEHGPCKMEDNKKIIKILGMPTTCPYGLDVYADFTAAVRRPRNVKNA